MLDLRRYDERGEISLDAEDPGAFCLGRVDPQAVESQVVSGPLRRDSI